MKPLIRLFERARLATKLLVGYLTISLICLGIGWFGLASQNQLNGELQALYSDQLQSISRLKQAQVDLAVMGRAIRQLALARDALERERGRRDLNEANDSLGKNIDAIRSSLADPDDQRDLSRFEERLTFYKRNLDRTAILYERDQTRTAAQDFLGSTDFQLVAIDAVQALDRIIRTKEEEASRLAQRAQERFDLSRQWTWLLLGTGFGISLLCAFLTSRSIQRPTDRLADTVDRLAGGELALSVPMTDYPNEIGSLARSIEVLRHGARDTQLQRWIKTHEAAIGNALQGASSLSDLAERFFSVAGPLLELGHGAFYMLDASDHLELMTGYAWRERKQLNQRIAIGEGLIGQCVRERQPILLANPPADYIKVASSLGERSPACILALPLTRGERVLGAIEIAAFHAFSADEQTLLDSILPMLALGVENFQRNADTERLLAQTRAQADAVDHQKQALEAQQAALADTESWYRSIIESAPDGMLVVAADGRITLANPQAAAMFGYTVDELLGHPVDGLVPETVRQMHAGQRAAFLDESAGQRSMGTDRSNLHGVRKDGSTFAIEVNLSRLPPLGERGVCICAALRDVSERKHMEQALRESELRVRQVLDNSPAGVAIMRSDGQQIYANRRLASLLGVTPEEMKWRRSSEFWDDPAERSQLLELISRQGSVSNFEARFRRSDGELLTILLSSAIVETADGRCTVSWFYDVTELKKAETAIAEHNLFQQALLDSIPYPVFYKGPDTRFIGVNRAYEQTFGIDRATLIGRRVLDLDYLPEADRLRYQAEDEAVIAEAGRVQREMPIPFADGQLHDTLYFVAGFRNPAGEPAGLVGTFVDMEPRKAAERALTHPPT